MTDYTMFYDKLHEVLTRKYDRLHEVAGKSMTDYTMFPEVLKVA